MYSALKITVSRNDGTDDKTRFINSSLNFFWKRARITNTCGTTVTNNIEPKCIQIFLEARCFVVFSYNPTAWGE
jgi:hypothetical protein